MSRFQDNGSGFCFRGFRRNILVGPNRLEYSDSFPRIQHFTHFNQLNGIGPLGHRSSGHNSHGFTGIQFPGHSASGPAFADNAEFHRSIGNFIRDYGIAVHSRTAKRRDVGGGDNILG
jgi:hypothetical protein